jgi:hypothetical protein
LGAWVLRCLGAEGAWVLRWLGAEGAWVLRVLRCLGGVYVRGLQHPSTQAPKHRQRS